MVNAELSIYDGYITVATHIYPCNILSDPLCKLSEDGKSFIVPTGNSPTSPWKWRFKNTFETAIITLLQKHGFIIEIINYE